jgi:hypothetical protein
MGLAKLQPTTFKAQLLLLGSKMAISTSSVHFSRLKGLHIRSMAQCFCELNLPQSPRIIRKFVEFAPRGAFQARIRGDFSPFLAKPGIFICRNIAS